MVMNVHDQYFGLAGVDSQSLIDELRYSGRILGVQMNQSLAQDIYGYEIRGSPDWSCGWTPQWC
jgi:hypothetical protein